MKNILKWCFEYTVSQRLKFIVNSFIFKLKPNLLPEYISDRLKVFITKNCGCNSNQMQNSVLYRDSNELNKLPIQKTNCNNLNKFKSLLRLFVCDEWNVMLDLLCCIY